jgi:hypothetical protein
MRAPARPAGEPGRGDERRDRIAGAEVLSLLTVFPHVTREAVAAALRETGEVTASEALDPARHGWRWHVALPGGRLLLVPSTTRVPGASRENGACFTHSRRA